VNESVNAVAESVLAKLHAGAQLDEAERDSVRGGLFDALLARFRATSAAQQPAEPRAFQHGEYVWWTSLHGTDHPAYVKAVWPDDIEVHVTPGEFQIALYVQRHEIRHRDTEEGSDA
jgi:hypothetical protein